MSKVMNIN